MGNMASRMFMCGEKERAALIRVALGVEPADMVILNGSVVNVYSGEIVENCAIGIKDKWIASVGQDSMPMIGESTQVIDAAGKTVIPGFIEGHTHMVYQTIEAFMPYFIKGGTTTVITETMDILPIAGYEGYSEFLDSMKDQPVKVLGTSPTLLSTSKAVGGISRETLDRILAREDIVGLGESFWQSVLQAPEAILPLFQNALDRGKCLEGHAAGAKGRKLTAYAAAGISSCHESISAEDALERLRLGLYVMAREGGVRKDLEEISKIRHSGVSFRRLILATDSIDPVEVAEKGYLEVVVQKAISCGFDPVSAIQMTTLNVAEHFGLESVIGGIAPGRCADIVVIPDESTITPQTVISNGRVVFNEGKILAEARKHNFPDSCFQNMRLERDMKPSDFEIHADGPVKLRVIEMINDLVSKELHADFIPVEGKIKADLDRDIIKIAAIDYRLNPGKLFTGLIKGFGIQGGAFALTNAWDTSDILVAGVNDEDMAMAANRIRSMQGGFAVCRDGKILAELPLPLFGILSDLGMEQLAEKLKAIREAARGLGVPFFDPVLSLATQTGAAIPYLKICEEGLVNLKDGKTLPLEVN